MLVFLIGQKYNTKINLIKLIIFVNKLKKMRNYNIFEIYSDIW